MIATVIVNGEDNYASFISFVGGTPLGSRLSSFLSVYDQVLQVSVVDQSRLFSIWGGTYPYQATIRLDTKNMPATTAAIVERVKLAVVQATGHFPTAVAVTSAGQVAPPPPDPGLVDVGEDIAFSLADLVRKTSNGLGVTVDTAKLLLVAVGLGGIALVYFIATKPGQAARIVRG